jgi:hypothetical protein
MDKPRTELEHICAMTGTAPEVWARIPRGHKQYAQGYRWWNKETGELVRKVVTEDSEDETNDHA